MAWIAVKTLGLSLVLIVMAIPLYSQNLVKNPSFEKFRQCPDRLGNFHADVVDWSSPSQASTDYFNACSAEMGTPENFNGSQPANFGGGYAGLYVYAPNDYREYIQGELLETLREGETYEIGFYVSLAERSDFAVREFGLVFSEKELVRDTKKMLSKMQLYQQSDNAFTFLQITHTDFYKETTDWVELKAQFVASGRENFVTIGNFEDNARTRTYKTNRNAKQGAYYYLDMVHVTRVGGGVAVAGAHPIDGQETYSLDTEHVFSNVLFGFDEFLLDANARDELKRLYDYLNTHKMLNITINGHTDNQGSAEYNLRLAENRCKEVAEYLLQLGLTPERIQYISHGYGQPIADNGTEEGRHMNRRVAFSLTRSPNK